MIYSLQCLIFFINKITVSSSITIRCDIGYLAWSQGKLRQFDINGKEPHNQVIPMHGVTHIEITREHEGVPFGGNNYNGTETNTYKTGGLAGDIAYIRLVHHIETHIKSLECRIYRHMSPSIDGGVQGISPVYRYIAMDVERLIEPKRSVGKAKFPRGSLPAHNPL